MFYLARSTGLEPATSSVTGKRSNQLSYARIFPLVEGVGGKTCTSDIGLMSPMLYYLSYADKKQTALLFVDGVTTK